MLAFRTVTYCTENEETPVQAVGDQADKVEQHLQGRKPAKRADERPGSAKAR